MRHFFSYLDNHHDKVDLRERSYLLGAALLSAGLPGHLLHHIPALLPGGGETLPGAGAGALLLVNILGDGGELVLADLVRNLVTHLARRVDITTHLEDDENQRRKQDSRIQEECFISIEIQVVKYYFKRFFRDTL